jgi:O-antigen/teichoic acid export membrane protein
MSEVHVERAGSALTWRGIQLGTLQLVFLLRILILARLLTPEDFGLLTIAVTSIGFLLSISDLGMIPALVQGTDVDEQTYNAAWTVGVTRAFVISALVILFADPIARLFGEPSAVPIIRVLALRPPLESLASIKVAGLHRDLHFRPLALAKVGEASVNTIVSIALAALLGVWALVAGALAGAVTMLVMSYVVAPYRPHVVFDRAISGPLFDFGRWIFLSGVVAMLGHNVVRIVISRQLGVAELGLYYMATQIAFLPGMVSSEVIGAVAFPLFSRLQSDVKQATEIFKALVTGTSALLFPVCTLLFALAPSLVTTVLGPQWSGTEWAIRVLALATVFDILGDTVSPLLQGFGWPSRQTAVVVVQSIVLGACAWILTGPYGLVGASSSWLIANGVAQLLATTYLRQLLDRPLSRLAVPLLAITSVAWIGAAVAWGISQRSTGILGLGLSVAISLAVITGLYWSSERRIGLGLSTSVRLVFPHLFPHSRHASAKGGLVEGL